MKDEALSNDQVKIAELPIAKSLIENKSLKKTVGDLIGTVNLVSAVDASIQEWLHQEFGMKRGFVALRNPSALSFDDFIKAVKGGLERGRKLTASEINELKREYGTTLAPAIESRAEITKFEGAISDIVNAAYGLSQEEIALLWSSAPPRMPFTPAGLIEESAVEMQDDEDRDS